MEKGKTITWLKFRYHIWIIKRSTILQSDLCQQVIYKIAEEKEHTEYIKASLEVLFRVLLFIYQAKSKTPKLSESKLPVRAHSTRSTKTFLSSCLAQIKVHKSVLYCKFNHCYHKRQRSHLHLLI